MLIPYAKYRMRVRAEERSKIEGTGSKVRRTQAEKGLYLEQYDRESSALLLVGWLLLLSHHKERTLPGVRAAFFHVFASRLDASCGCIANY